MQGRGVDKGLAGMLSTQMGSGREGGSGGPLIIFSTQAPSGRQASPYSQAEVASESFRVLQMLLAVCSM